MKFSWTLCPVNQMYCQCYFENLGPEFMRYGWTNLSPTSAVQQRSWTHVQEKFRVGEILNACVASCINVHLDIGSVHLNVQHLASRHAQRLRRRVAQIWVCRMWMYTYIVQRTFTVHSPYIDVRCPSMPTKVAAQCFKPGHALWFQVKKNTVSTDLIRMESAAGCERLSESLT